MAIKRKGIIARPGEYTYKDKGTEVKTAEELKAAVTRQPIIPLTFGHPADGIPRARDFIGTVSQKWNEEKQYVEGDFWFYDETPPEILDKIVNGWPTKISTGFTVDSVEDATQKGIFYTHVAILKDGDDPKCPLGQCGVNVRMESNNPTDYRHEQASNPDAKKDDTTDAAGTGEPTTGEFTPRQLEQLRDLFAASTRPKEPVEQKPEVEQPAETPPQKEPEPVRAPAPEPVRETPASVPVSDDFERDPVTGGIVFSGKHDGSKKK